MHQFAAGTHVGNVRDNNEDSYICDPDKELWIVADGMGGLGFGEVASAISTYTIQSQLREGHGINQAIELAHKRIKEFAAEEAMGTNMGTTLVLLLSQGSLYNIFWVGDSRAYSFDGQLTQMTVDHSLVQSLIEQGELTQEEASIDPRKNAVTRALGVQELETARVDSISDKWSPNQKILLCSDGLTDCVDDKTIQAILSEEGSDQARVDNLIGKALKQGGKDNITVLLISAPAIANHADSDTHVPASINNSTQTDSDTQKTTSLKKESVEPVQLEMIVDKTPTLLDSIETPAEKPINNQIIEKSLTSQVSNSHIDSETSTKESIWAINQKWIIAAALSITMILFARLTTADKPGVVETPFSTGELIEQTTVSSMPQTLSTPNVSWPVSGTVIQMGIFAKLTGAEFQQNKLNALGFSPYIEKKLDANNVLYALLLGPYVQGSQLLEIKDKLKSQKFDYFERPDSRY
ncbi:MAG: serine/threonine protein phosphatase PrpC [Flavobacterium sp.]